MLGCGAYMYLDIGIRMFDVDDMNFKPAFAFHFFCDWLIKRLLEKAVWLDRDLHQSMRGWYLHFFYKAVLGEMQQVGPVIISSPYIYISIKLRSDGDRNNRHWIWNMNGRTDILNFKHLLRFMIDDCIFDVHSK